MKTHARVFSLVTLCLGLLLVPTSLHHAARADGMTEIRMATVAPKGSKAERILRAWDMSVREKTGGRIKFRFYAGGIAGDERDVLRKIKVSQLDATTLTSVGLGQIVRSASVLQVPGLFKSYKDLAAVRAAMDAEWRKAFLPAQRSWTQFAESDCVVAARLSGEPGRSRCLAERAMDRIDWLEGSYAPQ